MNQIRHNLYLGNRDDAKASALKATPITAILNVTAEVPEDKSTGLVFVRVAMRDNIHDIHANNDEAVSVLTDLLANGHIVLVHCRHGKSRSPHIVAETLAQLEKRDYFEVYEEVRKLRPEVLAYSVGQEIVDKRLL